ncbi:hypothetical protein CIW50_11595 [Tardiphaga sp. P9-11]|nr:hypothetical protein CIW50_11595 [Tardiphaga sp. P9-11]
MRWRRRCGVTRFMGDVCLRAGRICASTATGKETAGLRIDKPLDSVTDDFIRGVRFLAALIRPHRNGV